MASSDRLPFLGGALALGALLVPAGAVLARAADDEREDEHAEKKHVMVAPDDIEWSEGPRSLPEGAQFAVLSGDPAEEGPFTMRIEVPAGYRIPPHWHPRDEHVTVVEGSFHMAVGERFDPSEGRELRAGAFAHMSPGLRHYAWSERGAVVQIHGVGPWGIEYVNPEDDPRRRDD